MGRLGFSMPVVYVDRQGFNYVVDAVAGNDGNDGTTPAAAWASLESNLTEDILIAGKTVRVLVKAGTYTDQAIIDLNATTGKVDAILEIVFEPGCTVEWTLGTDKSAVDVRSTGHDWVCRIFGNGLIITGFDTGTGNGLGVREDVTLVARNVIVTDCVDGVSAHGNGIIICYDCEFSGCSKSAFAHIDTSRTFHYNCTFTAAAGASLSIGSNAGTAMAYFENCDFIPNANLDPVDFSNCIIHKSRIGTLTNSVTLNANATLALVTDSFLNVYVDGDEEATFERCYGKFSTRVRNAGHITVTNGVFTGPAAGQSNTVFSNFNPTVSNKFIMNNNIFKGSWTFMSLDAQNSGYLVAAGSEFFNNILHPSLVYDSDLIAADTGGTVIVGTITSDPLIGDADTLVQADYAFGEGSPAEGAGTNGVNIGFSLSDI